jgi:hypothetical protein
VSPATNDRTCREPTVSGPPRPMNSTTRGTAISRRRTGCEDHSAYPSYDATTGRSDGELGVLASAQPFELVPPLRTVMLTLPG